jgi:UDP-N-acetylglucosamine acyltransferase
VKIHPTAIVDAGANIADSVEIGPYCVVGADATIGENTRLQSHCILEGSVRLGAGNYIGHGAVIGAPPQDLSYDPQRKTGVEIGDDNVIREYCTIHRGTADGTSTHIGNKNFMMANAHVGHNCDIGNHVIVANNCLLAGYVTVGDGAFLGGGAGFHQFMRIGRLVMVQGLSAFGKDLPPFVLAAKRNLVVGLNTVGLRRAKISAADRNDIKAAFRLIYTSGMNISQALEKGATMNFGAHGREFLDFVAAAKKRGICRYKGAEDGEEQE